MTARWPALALSAPATVVPGIVPAVVPVGTRAPTRTLSETGDDSVMTGIPGRARTCDPRFRKPGEACAAHGADARTDTPDSAEHGEAIDWIAADGFTSDLDPAPGTKPASCPAGTRGLVGVRVEIDGRTVARIDVADGDNLADVEARLRVAVDDAGGLR